MSEQTQDQQQNQDKALSAPVRVEREGPIGLVVMNRPEKRNALDLAMRRGIASAFQELSNDPNILVIIVTGGDKVFAAGADLKLLVDKDSQQVAELNLPGYWEPVASCQKPVIAAVNGYCLGAGSELMMMCDIIVVDKSARIGQPEANVGIMPGAGGTQRLVRAIGKPVASLMLMCGEMLTGERAYQLGLASDLAEEGQALDRARQLALRVTAMPPKAIGSIKRTLAQGPDLPLQEALSLEHQAFLQLFDTADQTEGMQAFIEKRKPNFTGK